MFKNFHGFHLVEKYQEAKKIRREDNSKTIVRLIKLFVALAAGITLWALPTDIFGIEGFTVIQQRTMAIFVFAILMWILEVVPAWTTSVLVVVLLLFSVTESSIWFFKVEDKTGLYRSDNRARHHDQICEVLEGMKVKGIDEWARYELNELGERKNIIVKEDGSLDTVLVVPTQVMAGLREWSANPASSYEAYGLDIWRKAGVDEYQVSQIDSMMTGTINPDKRDSTKNAFLVHMGEAGLKFKQVESVDTATIAQLNRVDDIFSVHTASYKSILGCFADPIIMLFIGGFILAIAATKSGLDVFLARVMLKPFGTKSKNVLLGFILVTAVFSMFLSNTATAAMMLMFLTPVLKSLPADGKGKIALALAIPIAANIGGMGTPIGTPPNAIALKYLNDPEGLNLDIGFGEWMSFMIPLTLVLLFIAWGVLLKLFPFKQKTIELNIDGEVKKDWRSILVYITFAVTVLLWMTDKVTGVNSNVVAMLPVGVFAITGIITKRDLEEINWSVLWMVAGGFALGVALQQTGLASKLISAIPFSTWPPVAVVVGSGLICYAMANFISHTATAALLVPILAVVGTSMQATLAPLGGVATLLVGVALGSSVAMILPISTPPNALAHATGMIEQKYMVKTGVIMGAIGLVIGYATLIVLGTNGLI